MTTTTTVPTRCTFHHDQTISALYLKPDQTIPVIEPMSRGSQLLILRSGRLLHVSGLHLCVYAA